MINVLLPTSASGTSTHDNCSRKSSHQSPLCFQTNLSRKDLALAREVWNEGCGNSQQALTEVGVELFIQ